MTNELEYEKILPDYINWFLKSKGLKIERDDNNEVGNNSIKESENILKHRESEQVQELLVGLTNELFNKIEQINPSKKECKNEEENLVADDPIIEETNPMREECKIEFSDISWYKEKLGSTK